MLLFWIGHGVKTFRVDNPHTKPFAFWEWVIAEVRRDHPDVVFLTEAFTKPKKLLHLAKLGFSQSYSYFTWKNADWEIQQWLERVHSRPTSSSTTAATSSRTRPTSCTSTCSTAAAARSACGCCSPAR